MGWYYDVCTYIVHTLFEELMNEIIQDFSDFCYAIFHKNRKKEKNSINTFFPQ